MRIAHISDLHLGYTSGQKRNDHGVNLREQDGYDAYNECIEQIIKEKPDICVCTGDFFHTPSPSTRTISVGLEGIEKLFEAGIPFYCLAGNHDCLDDYTSIPANLVLNLKGLKSYSFGTPYEVVEFDKVALHFVSHHGYHLQSKTMEEVKPIKDKVNILLTHGSCYDDLNEMVLKTELSPREVIIPEDVLNLGWDCIMLGHIHSRGYVGDKKHNRFYNGSLVRRGWVDKEGDRGWTLWEVNEENGECEPTLFNVTQRPQYEITIDAENKSVDDINIEVKKKLDELDYESTPIVRVVLSNITSKQKLGVDFSSFSDYSRQCLTFTTKTITKEEEKVVLSSEQAGYNLFDAFLGYWDKSKKSIASEYRETTKDKSIQYLREGQSITLEE